jgi:hypothetical protein
LLDLTATAAANTGARRAAADAVIAGDGSGRLAALRDLVGGSAMSSNVSADKVMAFDRAGAVVHARQFCVDEAGGDEAAGLAAFAALQAEWLVRREGFEDLWDHGRRFVYGAVNAGGMGTEGRFGPFCLVVADPEQPPPDALAVFPADSAGRYTDEVGAVDDGAVKSEATAWAARGDLAVTERGDEALGVGDDQWSAVVCQPGRYLETVRAGSLPVERVAELRLRASFRATLDRLRARAVRRDILIPTDANLAAAYDVANRWRRSHGLSIDDVPDP